MVSFYFHQKYSHILFLLPNVFINLVRATCILLYLHVQFKYHSFCDAFCFFSFHLKIHPIYRCISLLVFFVDMRFPCPYLFPLSISLHPSVSPSFPLFFSTLSLSLSLSPVSISPSDPLSKSLPPSLSCSLSLSLLPSFSTSLYLPLRNSFPPYPTNLSFSLSISTSHFYPFVNLFPPTYVFPQYSSASCLYPKATLSILN